MALAQSILCGKLLLGAVAQAAAGEKHQEDRHQAKDYDIQPIR